MIPRYRQGKSPCAAGTSFKMSSEWFWLRFRTAACVQTAGFIQTVLDLKCPNEARHVSGRAHSADSNITSGVTSPLIQHGEHLSCLLHLSCALGMNERLSIIEYSCRFESRPVRSAQYASLLPQQTRFRSAFGELSTCGMRFSGDIKEKLVLKDFHKPR